MNCTGKGGPTVVVEDALEDFSFDGIFFLSFLFYAHLHLRSQTSCACGRHLTMESTSARAQLEEPLWG